MDIIPVKTPKLVRSLFPSYIWEVPSKEKTLYLTFDDGPTPEITNWTLDLLNQYNAKATFFCIGSNIEKHPEIFKDIVTNKHSIGNHTFNHLKGWKTSTKLYIDNTIKTQTTIDRFGITNKSTTKKLFRPPYGKLIPKQGKALQKLGYDIVMWNVLSFDWDKSVTKEKCLDNVIQHAKSGSIIVFHDSIKASNNLKYCLPKVLDYFSEKGYNFKSL